MSERRPPLAPSSSQPGPSSESTVPRPLKRSITTADLDFFTPAATSFCPTPYNPADLQTVARHRSVGATRGQRTLDLNITQGMDPSPQEGNVIFVRTPFTKFPGSEEHSGGLTFNLMMENPDWFLDASDFVRVEGDGSGVTYPSALEPPRGWCPAKKKDLKDKGTDNWPEGEEPRLRCTFCRRTYAGVNAKSMWRRHVFEKHRIPMANRRDTGDRPRGRGSAKENKQPNRDKDAHSTLTSIKVIPHLEPNNSVLTPSQPDDNATMSFTDSSASPPPVKSEIIETILSTPPPTPPEGPNPTRSDIFSSPERPVIPASPYDPTATPAFRHSSPQHPQPSQPWRVLHANATAFLRPDSPSVQDSPISRLGTPFRPGGIRSLFGMLGTPDSLPKGRKHAFSKLESSPSFPASSHSRLNSVDWMLSSHIGIADDTMTDPFSLHPPTPLGLRASPRKGHEWESPIVRSASRTSLLAPIQLDDEKESFFPQDTDMAAMAAEMIRAVDSLPSTPPPPKKRRIFTDIGAAT